MVGWYEQNHFHSKKHRKVMGYILFLGKTGYLHRFWYHQEEILDELLSLSVRNQPTTTSLSFPVIK